MRTIARSVRRGQATSGQAQQAEIARWRCVGLREDHGQRAAAENAGADRGPAPPGQERFFAIASVEWAGGLEDVAAVIADLDRELVFRALAGAAIAGALDRAQLG